MLMVTYTMAGEDLTTLQQDYKKVSTDSADASAKLQISFHLFRLFRACPVAMQADKSQQVRLTFSISKL